MIALKKRNKNKRFLLSFCALLVVVAMVSVGVTLALTKVAPYTTNVVTIGEVKIELIDKYYDNEDKQTNKLIAENGENYSETNPPVFLPNSDVKKTIQVQNVGKYPCYVRLLVRKQWVYEGQDTETGQQMLFDIDAPNGEEELEQQVIRWQVNSGWVRGITPQMDAEGNYIQENGQVLLENQTIEFDECLWDYCYYYQNILYPNQKTEPLFVDNEFHIDYYNRDYGDKAVGHIFVAAQAIQSDYTQNAFGDLENNADKDKTFFKKSNKIVKWNDNLLFE